MLRRHAGEIVYHHADGVQGREHFDIDVRANGRTIRSYCEMAEGDLTRDASWTLDADHLPIEGHVRVVQHGELVGSTWYRFRDDAVECEALTAGMGRISQVLPGRHAYLGLHPLVGDGMIALAVGTDRPGETRQVRSVTCSYDIAGESALLALPITIAVTFLDTAEVDVPAGRFEANRFHVQWRPDWPPAELWVHGEDALFLRLRWEISGLDAQLMHYTAR